MIVQLLTRESTNQMGYGGTSAGSQTSAGDNFGNTANSYCVVSYNGFTSSTVYSAQGDGSTSLALSDGGLFSSAGQTYGATTYQDATLFSSASSEQFNGSWTSALDASAIATTGGSFNGFSETGYSTGTPITDISTFTNSTSFSTTYNTTSNVVTNTWFWTVTGKSLFQSGTTASVVSNMSTTPFGDMPVTVSSVITQPGFGITTTTYASPLEEGSAITADYEWLWVVTQNNYGTYLLTDCAMSFNESTFWASVSTSAHSYVLLDNLSEATQTTSSPDATASLSYQGLVVSTSITDTDDDFSSVTQGTTVTSGTLLSRDTVNSSFTYYTTTTASIAWGTPSATFSALSLSSYSYTTTYAYPVAVTQLYPVDGTNYSTTELQSYVTDYTTTSIWTPIDQYVVSFSEGGDDFTSVQSFSFVGTDVGALGTAFTGWGGMGAATFEIPRIGCFVAPSNLRSANHPYSFVDNLSFAGSSQIPYSDMLSVFSNAQVPNLLGTTSYPGSTYTNPSGATLTADTWFYSWSKDTLKLTHASTYASGASTLTTRTVTSGTFNGMNDVPPGYSATAGPWGGRPAVSTASETIWFPPRAVKGTVINDTSSTYRTLVTDTASLQILNTVVTEAQIPAFVVWTSNTTQAATTTFVRNSI
jgi:hypothetical protein